MSEEQKPLLAVTDLAVNFGSGDRVARAVEGVSFSVGKGETLGLVGESGCGKSVTSLAIMRLLSDPGFIARGRIEFEGKDLVRLSNEQMRHIRGNKIAMIFQEPMTSLNPVYTVGDQVMEAVLTHEKITPEEAYVLSEKALTDVGIPNPKLRMTQYPHELSGGMKQRVMIAMGLVCRPEMLICDEPTTALDVTIQAQILDLLRKLQSETGMSMLFITHDLGVIAELAHRVCVMYAGRVVEKAVTDHLFAEPLHPYTVGLFRSLPNLTGERKKLYTIPGMVPSPLNPPPGCRFHPRCERATEICKQQEPALEEKRPGRLCACHHVAKEMA